MEYHQQLEEILVERPPSAYDAIMESPLDRNYIPSTIQDPRNMNKMDSSLNSTLEDTTPSDSGVQLDSEVSDVMIDSLTSQNGLGLDNEDIKSKSSHLQSNCLEASLNIVKAAEEATIIDNNSNVTTFSKGVEETMAASACSTFDTNTSENIVFRRKVRKNSNNCTPKAPKKRVSFHEDILKSKRTDNIHIEHGFITYKNGRKVGSNVVTAGGRYSWCAEGKVDSAEPTELCANDDDEGEQKDACGRNGSRRRVVYRNACSDVLDYGNSDAYETNEPANLRYDNSGVFEYFSKSGRDSKKTVADVGNVYDLEQNLYKCSCSSSNSSLESEEPDKNSNRQTYNQAKSNSCDCIGMSHVNNNLIGDNCYYSEPSIENIKEKKSVWNKEKKPKSSCLKKTKHNINVILEQDINRKVKKFNVHDMNQLFDNSSKMIFGSLKSIFTLPLPERGVPEGSEDLQAVAECIPELEQTPEHKPIQQDSLKYPESPILKTKAFLSKSLDGSKKQPVVKKFVHNVDEQLRRKNEEELYIPTRENSDEVVQPTAERETPTTSNKIPLKRQDEIENVEVREASFENSPCSQISSISTSTQQFRNKFIVNCESTVFEHTGISYETHSNDAPIKDEEQSKGECVGNHLDKKSLVAQAESESLTKNFITKPFAKSITSFFKSFKDSSPSSSSAKKNKAVIEIKKQAAKQNSPKLQQEVANNYFAQKLQQQQPFVACDSSEVNKSLLKTTMSTTNSSSTLSDITMSTSSNPSSFSHNQKLSNPSTSKQAAQNPIQSSFKPQELRSTVDKQNRHLPSPLKKRSSGTSFQCTQPPRYSSTPYERNFTTSPASDLLNTSMSSNVVLGRGGSGRDSKSTILSDDFDDILTITTTETDKPESDIVILDYPDINDRQAVSDFANLLKPPHHPAAKTSLINRFLRNVTQKKIMETSIRNNNFFVSKLNNEQRLNAGNLYVPGVKLKNFDLIDDLNAEIAMEIEMSGANSPRRELTNIQSEASDGLSRFDMGIGEVSIELFKGKTLPILRETSEELYKVFKLYIGYSREGFMTPVLVFLSNKALYVTDMVRNRLCTKFVLAYDELDVILMGPYGNTVLLSNSSRDMQQVLLAGGPYPAAALVSNLELCARRNGSTLPAVGHLSLDHLTSLQSFVRANSCVDKNDPWMFYAVVNVSSGSLGSTPISNADVEEALGPHIKGFLMHRRVKINSSINELNKISWNPGYFLLKAGVLYMFNDSCQKLPSWAMALAECQGARRALKTGRPHCFEIILKDKVLQLAAPDEYVASEWLQSLLQSASGLFQFQEKHKTLGCTLVITQNRLVTLREDFSAPLRQICKSNPVNLNIAKSCEKGDEANSQKETGSLVSSGLSTPQHSSVNSTPTKMSQISRSSVTTIPSISLASSLNPTKSKKALEDELKENYSDMCSVYGKNSGLEVLTCADIKEMTGIKISSQSDNWWCILEFSCQEAPLDCSDDLIIFFASSLEMQRFLRLLEGLWQAKNIDLFPITILDEDDTLAEQCTMLYMDINRSWEPLLTAALGSLLRSGVAKPNDLVSHFGIGLLL